MTKKRSGRKVKSKHRKLRKKSIRKKAASSEYTKTEDQELNLELKALEQVGPKKIVQKEEVKEKPTRIRKTAQKTYVEEKPMGVRETIQPEINGKNTLWFYIGSVFAAYLFTAYISIFAALHFENLQYINITLIFLFVSFVSFFLISAIYFHFEKNKKHSNALAIFFIGLVSIMIYAFKAADNSDLARYSIMYTIIVVAISVYVLAVKKGFFDK